MIGEGWGGHGSPEGRLQKVRGVAQLRSGNHGLDRDVGCENPTEFVRAVLEGTGTIQEVGGVQNSFIYSVSYAEMSYRYQVAVPIVARNKEESGCQNAIGYYK